LTSLSTKPKFDEAEAVKSFRFARRIETPRKDTRAIKTNTFQTDTLPIPFNKPFS
jgi:hypothetical protein